MPFDAAFGHMWSFFLIFSLLYWILRKLRNELFVKVLEAVFALDHLGFAIVLLVVAFETEYRFYNTFTAIILKFLP